MEGTEKHTTGMTETQKGTEKSTRRAPRNTPDGRVEKCTILTHKHTEKSSYRGAGHLKTC